MAGGGPVTGHLAARAAAAALLAGHLENASAVEGGGGGEGGDRLRTLPKAARPLLAGRGRGWGHGGENRPGGHWESSGGSRHRHTKVPR